MQTSLVSVSALSETLSETPTAPRVELGLVPGAVRSGLVALPFHGACLARIGDREDAVRVAGLVASVWTVLSPSPVSDRVWCLVRDGLVVGLASHGVRGVRVVAWERASRVEHFSLRVELEYAGVPSPGEAARFWEAWRDPPVMPVHAFLDVTIQTSPASMAVW